MKRIAFTRADGGLSIMIPVEDGRFPEETDAEFLDRLKKDIPSDAMSIQEIEPTTIPQDRTFRDAWAIIDGAVAHDMDKAREIQKDRMRAVRAPLLESLDVKYQRADEAGDTDLKRSIATEKQVLRDVTKVPEIAAAQTVEELTKVWPDVLT